MKRIVLMLLVVAMIGIWSAPAMAGRRGHRRSYVQKNPWAYSRTYNYSRGGYYWRGSPYQPRSGNFYPW